MRKVDANSRTTETNLSGVAAVCPCKKGVPAGADPAEMARRNSKFAAQVRRRGGDSWLRQGEQNEEQNNATGMMQLPASNLLPSLRLILRRNVQIMCTASYYTTKRQHRRSASSSSARRAPHRFNKDRHKTAAGTQAIRSKIAAPKTHCPTESQFSSLAKNRSQTFLNMATQYSKKLFTNMEVDKTSYNCTSVSETV